MDDNVDRPLSPGCGIECAPEVFEVGAPLSVLFGDEDPAIGPGEEMDSAECFADGGYRHLTSEVRSPGPRPT